MTAIRRDDKMDETHSIYVDQWDWEKVIQKEDRTLELRLKQLDTEQLALKTEMDAVKKVIKKFRYVVENKKKL